MLKIEKSFYDVIDIAKNLLGPSQDRQNVNPEYQRAVLELIADLTIGTEEGARLFLADELGIDHEVGSHPATSTDGEPDLAAVAVNALVEAYSVISRMESNQRVEPSEIKSTLTSIEQTGIVRTTGEEGDRHTRLDR